MPLCELKLARGLAQGLARGANAGTLTSHEEGIQDDSQVQGAQHEEVKASLSCLSV